jgi:hypothetical protein
MFKNQLDIRCKPGMAAKSFPKTPLGEARASPSQEKRPGIDEKPHVYH